MTGWRMLHAADLHLDSPFGGLAGLPNGVRDAIRGSTFRALDNLTALAIRERVRLVVLAGDVYDLEDRSIRAQLKFHDAVERLAEAGIAVCIAHGNHDPLSGRRLPWVPPRGVHEFAADEPETVPLHDAKGRLLAYVHGVSYGNAVVTENLAAKFRVHDRTAANIGVLHANVDGASDHGNYAPAARSQLIASGIDYWALGHIHARQVLNESPHIVYPGNTQGRSMKETGAKGCYVVEFEDARVLDMTFHETDAVRWTTLEVSVEEARTLLDVQELVHRKLDGLRAAAGGKPHVVRLVVRGRTGLHRELKRTSMLDELAAEWNETESEAAERDPGYPFVWIESHRLETRGLIDRAEWIGQDSFIGDMLRIAAEIRKRDDRLSAFADEVTEELLRTRVGRHLLSGQPLSGGGRALTDRDQLAELLARAEDWLLDMLVEGEDRR